MADVPGAVKYGRLTGRFVAFEADSSDASEIPDEIPLQGTVLLLCRIVDGWLLPPVGNTPGVTLVATVQPDAEPDTIQWKAKFDIVGAQRQPAELTFNVDADVDTDFSQLVAITLTVPVVPVVTTADRVAAEAAAVSAAATLSTLEAGIDSAIADYFAAHPGLGGGATDMAGITDASANGRDLVRAANYAAMKVLLGVPAIGTGSTDAKAGNYQPAAADISDAGTAGRQVLQSTTAAGIKSLLAIAAADISNASANGQSLIMSANYAAMRGLLGVPIVGTGATDAKAGNYQPTAANISDATTSGRAILMAANYATMKGLLALDQVDNTSDLNKPVSTAATAAFAPKVDAVFTGTFSVPDGTLTTAKIIAFDESVQDLVGTQIQGGTSITPTYNDTTGVVSVAFSPADGSIAQIKVTSLVSDMALKAPLANPTFTGTVSGITKTMVGLSNVDNTADTAKPVSTATATSIATKLSHAVSRPVFRATAANTWPTRTSLLPSGYSGPVEWDHTAFGAVSTLPSDIVANDLVVDLAP
jgi:hypothetical protein